VEIVSSLVDLLIILVAAKVGAELMAWIRQPPVIGELIMGMIVGASVLGWIDITEGGLISILAELGVIVLLFQVGLEIQMGDMLRLGPVAMFVAGIGVVTPFALGYIAAQALGLGGGSTEVALFMGAAMTATSVGITARVFSDLGKMESDEARVVIGAAVIDDVIGLVILAVVVGLLGGSGEFETTELWSLGLRVILFLAVAIGVGALLMPYLLRLLDALKVPGSYIIGTLVIAVSVGIAAESLAGLEPIVGAFVAGLIVAQADHIHRIQTEIAPIGYFLVPIFFLAVGAQVDVTVMFQPSVLGAGLLITALAVIGKIAAGLGTLGRPIRRTVVGVGMIPRGEVGLIFAALGATQLSSVVGDEEIAIVVLMVVLTTLVAPIVLGRLLRAAPAPTSSQVPPPTGGDAGSAGD
jgi:Kef-type K+ transport system membrane component KefB